jgi:hypothetical protein
MIAGEDGVLLEKLTGLLALAGGGGLLNALIDVAISNQLQRPVLARLLDAEEARLPPSEEKRRMHGILMTIFHRCLGESLLGREPRVAQDLFPIIRGMVDGAGQRGETDAQALARRVERAVSGYVGSYAP